MSKKILHLLTWEWKNIERHLPLIKETGFDAVQISPITPCKPLYDDNGKIKKQSKEWYDILEKEWYKLYQPVSYSSIGNFLGTEEDFISLCKKGNEIGIDIYPDIVARHVSNSEDNELQPYKEVDEKLLQYIKKEQINATNYRDRWQQINCSTNLPMFDYNNVQWQNEIILPFLLKVLKYSQGARFDQLCKHYSLPSEGGTFFQNVIAKLPKDKFYYGEGIEVEDKYLDEYSQYVVPLTAFHEYWGRKNVVKFMHSHDTVLSFLYHSTVTDEEKLRGYEEVLRQGTHGLFYARRNDPVIFSNAMKEINNRYK